MKRSILRTLIFSLIFVMLVTSSKCSSNSADEAATATSQSDAVESEEDEEIEEDPLPQEFLDINAKEMPIVDESDTAPVLEELNDVDRKELSDLIEITDELVPYTEEDKELDNQLGKDVGGWLTPENNEPAAPTGDESD